MSQKTYLWILKIGVLLTLTTVFFVFKELLFPFITSKQISFNIMVEIMAVVWLAFIMKYPEYRPRRDYIGYGLIAFFGALILSSFFSVDFNLSFWGDVERMLGVFHLLHFLLYYFIIVTVFREWKDWKLLLAASVICALGVSFKGLKEIAYSSIGNTAYVSGYLIFNMYFVGLLFLRERVIWLKWSYLIAIPVMLAAFIKANTAGAYVGLGLSLVLAVFLYGLLAWRHIDGKKGRNISIIMVALFVLAAGFITWTFVLDRDNVLTRNSEFMYQIVRDVDLNKNTFQTRLISWRAAWQDFKEHPIVGTGHGNYAIIFDKYFDPHFYDYTRSETYFDRAHNNVVDIASTTGLVGILTYFSIFAAAGYYLIRGYWDRRIGLHEFVLISALLAAYFIQNLAVFDSLVTYMMLMITLGFIYWNYEVEEKPWLDKLIGEARGALFGRAKDRKWVNEEIYALVIAGAVIFGIMYQYNIKPYQMLQGTIMGQRYWSTPNQTAEQKVDRTINAYKEALSLNTVLDRDSRTSLNRIFAGNPSVLRQLSRDKALEVLDYNIELAKANVDYNPQDSMNQMILAQLYNTASNYAKDDREKFAYYSNQALEAINASIAASPGRVPIYFQKAQIYITRGEEEKAVNTLKEAIALHPGYYDSSCHLAKTLSYYNREDEAKEYYDACIDLGGANILQPMAVVGQLINRYLEEEDYDKVIELYKQATNLEKNNVKHWISLAQLYQQQGQTEKARQAAEQAMDLDPTIKDYAQDFINSLE